MRDDRNDVAVSTITPWDVAIKTTLGRLSVDADLELEVARAGFRELPVRFEHAAALRGLPLLHRDPFDRMLVAQARHEGLTLVTRDAQVRAYPVASLKAWSEMRVAPIQSGDLIEVDKKGRRVFGLVLRVERTGEVRFEPLCPGVSWRSATAHEVTRHWRKAARRRGAPDPDVHEGQLGLDGLEG